MKHLTLAYEFVVSNAAEGNRIANQFDNLADQFRLLQSTYCLLPSDETLASLRDDWRSTPAARPEHQGRSDA